jgi:hypothetical protein
MKSKCSTAQMTSVYEELTTLPPQKKTQQQQQQGDNLGP